MSVADLVYKACGSPQIETTATGICRTCGNRGSGILFSKWVKDGFTNHDLLHPGDYFPILLDRYTVSVYIRTVGYTRAATIYAGRKWRWLRR